MRTVLILGAGASSAYGFPLGNGLIKQIEELLPEQPPNDYPNSDTPFGKLYRAYEEYWRQNKTTASKVIPGIHSSNIWSAGHEISSFRSRLVGATPNSIDAFLSRDYGDRTQHFRLIGKLTIAASIATVEQVTRFEISSSDSRKAHDWYPYLWSIVDRSRIEDIEQLPLKIISFNYDRSLERFLALRFAARIAPNGMILHPATVRDWIVPGVEAIANMQILHMYGSLGSLTEAPWGAMTDERDLKNMAARIRVIGEERSNEDRNVLQARDWLAEVERIVFLGFGFDPTNMQLMGFGVPQLSSIFHNSESSVSKKLFATTYGLEHAERYRIMNTYFGPIGGAVAGAIEDHLFNTPITQYLRQQGALFF